MLAYELKEYLAKIPDEANILIFVQKYNEIRQLLFADIDRDGATGHVIIDAEYKPPVKRHMITQAQFDFACRSMEGGEHE